MIIVVAQLDQTTGGYRLLITDFGLSKIARHAQTTVLHKGTPQYTPPEGYTDKKVDDKLDVFSFGIMLWEMWSREVPYYGLNNAQVMGSICGGKRPPIPVWLYLVVFVFLILIVICYVDE